MVKNKKKDNMLIRRSLVRKLKEKGIRRANEDALKEIEKFVTDEIENLIDSFKVHLSIKGKKTLKGGDVLDVVEEIKKGKEYFEV